MGWEGVGFGLGGMEEMFRSPADWGWTRGFFDVFFAVLDLFRLFLTLFYLLYMIFVGYFWLFFGYS